MGRTVVRTLISRKPKGRKQTGKGTKKYGRNLAKCAVYKAQNRREKNKVRKQKAHQKRVAKKQLKLKNKGLN